MKKTIKNQQSRIFPKGNLKEKFKLSYYRLFKPKNVFFEINDNSDKVIFKKKNNNITLNTMEALYPIVDDFNYYQHFNKAQPNDLIIDNGANCSNLSILFSKLVGLRGKIFAFEPDKFNIERILKNIKLNEDLSSDIKIKELLIWDKNEFIDFYKVGTIGSFTLWKFDNEKCVKKQAVCIDDWIKKNNIQKLVFINIDIERAEIEALEGCVETIKLLQPKFAIASYHIVNEEKKFIKVKQFFDSMNYPYKTANFKENEINTFAGFNLK